MISFSRLTIITFYKIKNKKVIKFFTTNFLLHRIFVSTYAGFCNDKNKNFENFEKLNYNNSFV
ncbi:MAG TPA: hypothetical protein [Caudoviricetes sp.]|nr:MAG TPA: hypothetical protein [Caudoviricetes sp.]